MGKGVLPKGEIRQNTPFYQKQFAASIALLVGEKFICEHPVAEPILFDK